MIGYCAMTLAIVESVSMAGRRLELMYYGSVACIGFGSGVIAGVLL